MEFVDDVLVRANETKKRSPTSSQKKRSSKKRVGGGEGGGGWVGGKGGGGGKREGVRREGSEARVDEVMSQGMQQPTCTRLCFCIPSPFFCVVTLISFAFDYGFVQH